MTLRSEMAAGFRAVAFCFALLLVFFCVDGSLVDDISNFQNEYVCDTRVRLVKPLSTADVQEAVKRHARVVPVGTGHSWNEPFFCAEPPSEDGETAASIVMTTIRPLEIDVNEADLSAWVSVGVTVWDLMSYLGNYVTESAPRGYALGATPFYVNQTIGGAIATNTHGSSLKHGSLSNQVIGFKVVLADGTLTEIYPDTDPLYFKAFQVNVGRLGVVTDVKMRIIRETPVKRTLQLGVPREDFLSRLRAAQDLYKSSGVLPDWLQPDVTFSWFPTDFTFAIYTLEEVEDTAPAAEVDLSQNIATSQATVEIIDAEINAPINSSRSEGGGEIADGVQWEAPLPLLPNPALQDPRSVQVAIDNILQMFLVFLGNATLDYHEAALIVPLVAVERDSGMLQDDHEVAVPVDKMADCLQGFMDLAENLSPDIGLRNIVVMRFSGKESGYLSVSNDKPVLWFSLQDVVYYNKECVTEPQEFGNISCFAVADESCSPVRLHWGKAGWPDPGCWNGAELYKETWCDFGCAVRALDPENKFIGSAPDRWNWEGADLERCCNAEGYDASLDGCTCNVIPLRAPDECPDPPFYTNR